MKDLFPASKAVTVSQRKEKLLNAILTSWVNLHRFGPFSELQLKMLIIVESKNRRRRHILKRLIGMLHTAERKGLYEELGL